MTTYYRQQIVEQASSLLGHASVSDIFGHPELGQSPFDGFDCSGFVKFVLSESGLAVPDYIGVDARKRPIRHTDEFWNHYGVNVQIPLPGDLVFFSRDGRSPTHMGVVRDEESFIHAPGKDGTRVMVSNIKQEPAPESTGTGSGRIVYAHNPIGFKAPTIRMAKPDYRHHQEII